MKAWELGVSLILRYLQDGRAECQYRRPERCLEQLSISQQTEAGCALQGSINSQKIATKQLMQAEEGKEAVLDCQAAGQEPADILCGHVA